MHGTNAGNDRSFRPLISDDGRYVFFESRASNLSVNDRDDEPDLYVRDMTAGTTTLVSAGSATAANFSSVGGRLAGISRNGRFVLFTSSTRAERIVTNGVISDINGVADLFVRDVTTGDVRCVSTNASGTATGDDETGVDAPDRGVVTDDGRFVLMKSAASDLMTTAFEPGFASYLYVHDMTSGVNDLVTPHVVDPTEGIGVDAREAKMTPDGRFVVFRTSSDVLTRIGEGYGNDVSPSDDVYLRDRTLRTTRLISKNRRKNAEGLGGAASPDISDDGQFVTFLSSRDLLNDPQQTLTKFHGGLYLWSAATDKLQIMNNLVNDVEATPFFGTFSPHISRDGRLVTFVAEAGGLTSNPADAGPDGLNDVVVRDRATATNHVVAAEINAFGAGASGLPQFSDDGSRVAFLKNNPLTSGHTTAESVNVYVADVPGGERARLLGGDLTLVGTYGDDVIGLGLDGDQLVGYVANESFQFPAADVKSVTIRAFGGDDDMEVADVITLGLSIDLGAGDDVLYSGAGDDTIYAGDGDDTVRGNSGDDRIVGGAGNDLLRGGAHKDQIDGQDGNDRVYGDGGNDKLYGAAGADKLHGGFGVNYLDGGSSDDWLYNGGSGVLLGQGGDDHFFTIDLDHDTLFGGSGTDSAERELGDVVNSIEDDHIGPAIG